MARGEHAVTSGDARVKHVIANKVGRGLLSLLLAFMLVPPLALQPAHALVDDEAVPAQEEVAAADELSAPESEEGSADAEEASSEDEGSAPEGDAADAQDAERSGSGEAALVSDSVADVASEANQPQEEAGIETHDEVAVETEVFGEIMFNEYWHWDEQGGSFVDRSFAQGLNKVAIDMSAHDGLAWTLARFEPHYEAGQDNVRADWDAIPVADRYNTDTLQVWIADRDVLALDLPQGDVPMGQPFPYVMQGDSPVLQFQALKEGRTEICVLYHYTNPDTRVTYSAEIDFTAHVAGAANEAVALETPSDEVTIWAYGDFEKPADELWAAYYYLYDCAEGFNYQEQEYMVACDMRIAEMPATFSFSELFDISIADTSVIAQVNNWQRSYYGGDIHCTGPDWRTYSLDFAPKHAGTTTVTFSLKHDPTQQKTIKVTVIDEHPEAVVSDHAIQVGQTQRIYVKGVNSTTTPPVYLPITAQYLNYATEQARPFITSLVSSNPDVVEVKPIEWPGAATRFAPYDIIPLSVGTADMTMTDCFGKEYRYTITVDPDPNTPTDPTVTIDAVKLMNGSTDVTKGSVTMSTRDIAGIQLGAEVVTTPADSPVTVEWKSTNASIAQVDEQGLVVPVRVSYNERTGKTDECRIEATVDGKVTAYCAITVEEPEHLCGAPTDSPLGAASIKLDKPLPQELLDELDSVSLAIAPISAGSEEAIDTGLGSLQSQGIKTGSIFNINFVNADGSEHRWNKPDYPLTVKIPMNAEMRELRSHGTLAFYHIDPVTGEVEKMRTWADAKLEFLYFETTHFSPFVLGVELDDPTVVPGGDEPPTTDDKPITGDDGSAGGAPTGGDTPQDPSTPPVLDDDQRIPVRGIVVIEQSSPARTLRTLHAIPGASLAQTGDVATRVMASGLLFAASSLLVLAVANRKRLARVASKKG